MTSTLKSQIENWIANQKYWFEKFQKTGDVTDLQMVETYAKYVKNAVVDEVIELIKKK